jgi:hypothetical protein
MPVTGPHGSRQTSGDGRPITDVTGDGVSGVASRLQQVFWNARRTRLADIAVRLRNAFESQRDNVESVAPLH